MIKFLYLIFHFEVVGLLKLIPPLGNSDHNGIQVETYFKQPAGNKVHLKRKVWCFDRGDYSKMKKMINSFSWNQFLSEDISSSVLTWQTHFFCIMEQCIPRKTLPSKKHLPYITKPLLTLMRKRNLFYKSWKKYGDRSAHLKYKILRNRLVALLRTVTQKYFQNLNIKEPKSFWRTFVN